MNLSNPQRLKKLVKHLVENPAMLPRYVRYSLLSRGMLPIDTGYPWWSFAAIDYVDTIVEGKRIFEWGTGGSTIRFAQRARRVTAVEDDERWLELVADRLRRLKLSNVSLLHRPFNFREPAEFLNSSYYRSLESAEYDIIIIDGQDWSFNERISCFERAEQYVRAGETVIIVDDFWRYERLLKENKARSVKVFESVGPCRIGVTSTAVFQY